MTTTATTTTVHHPPSQTFILGEFEKISNDAIETTLKRSLSALDVSRLNDRLSVLKLVFPSASQHGQQEVRENVIIHFIKWRRRQLQCVSDIRSSSSSLISSTRTGNTENTRSWINRLLARSSNNRNQSSSSKTALSISSSQYDFTRLNKYQVEFIIIVQYLFSSCVRTVLTTCKSTCYDKIGVHSDLYNELENILIGFSHWKVPCVPTHILASPILETMRRAALDFGAASLGALAISRARELQIKLLKPVQLRRTSITSHSHNVSQTASSSSSPSSTKQQDDEDSQIISRRNTWTIFASKNKQRMKRETEAALNVLSLTKQISLSLSTRFEFDQSVLWIESFTQLLESRHEGEVGDAVFDTIASVFERLSTSSFTSFSSECFARYHDALDKLLKITISRAGQNIYAWRCASAIFVCDFRSETWLDRIGLLIDPLCKKYNFFREKNNIQTCEAIVTCLTRLVEEMLVRGKEDEDNDAVDHINNLLISITSQLLMDTSKKSKTKKINSKKKTRRLHESLSEHSNLLYTTLNDFVVLMAQHRFDTIMLHIVLPLLRHRSSRETHAITTQMYFGMRVMRQIFEHISVSSHQEAWFPACRRDDAKNVLARAVRIYWDDIEAEMCRATSATHAALMGWDDNEMMSVITKSQCDLECDVATELLKCLHLVWPISQRLSRTRIVRFASRCALIRNQEKSGLICTARRWLRGAVKAGGKYPEQYRDVCSVSGMIGDVSKVIETLLSKEEDVDVIELECTLLKLEDGTSIQFLESPWNLEKTGYRTSSNLVVSSDHWARAQGIRIGSRFINTSNPTRIKKKGRCRVIKGMNLLLDFLSVCMSVSSDKIEDSMDILRNVEAVGTVLLCSNYGIERMLAVDVLRNVHSMRPRLSVYAFAQNVLRTDMKHVSREVEEEAWLYLDDAVDNGDDENSENENEMKKRFRDIAQSDESDHSQLFWARLLGRIAQLIKTPSMTRAWTLARNWTESHQVSKRSSIWRWTFHHVFVGAGFVCSKKKSHFERFLHRLLGSFRHRDSSSLHRVAATIAMGYVPVSLHEELLEALWPFETVATSDDAPVKRSSNQSQDMQVVSLWEQWRHERGKKRRVKINTDLIVSLLSIHTGLMRSLKNEGEVRNRFVSFVIAASEHLQRCQLLHNGLRRVDEKNEYSLKRLLVSLCITVRQLGQVWSHQNNTSSAIVLWRKLREYSDLSLERVWKNKVESLLDHTVFDAMAALVQVFNNKMEDEETVMEDLLEWIGCLEKCDLSCDAAWRAATVATKQLLRCWDDVGMERMFRLCYPRGKKSRRVGHQAMMCRMLPLRFEDHRNDDDTRLLAKTVIFALFSSSDPEKVVRHAALELLVRLGVEPRCISNLLDAVVSIPALESQIESASRNLSCVLTQKYLAANIVKEALHRAREEIEPLRSRLVRIAVPFARRAYFQSMDVLLHTTHIWQREGVEKARVAIPKRISTERQIRKFQTAHHNATGSVLEAMQHLWASLVVDHDVERVVPLIVESVCSSSDASEIGYETAQLVLWSICREDDRVFRVVVNEIDRRLSRRGIVLLMCAVLSDYDYALTMRRGRRQILSRWIHTAVVFLSSKEPSVRVAARKVVLSLVRPFVLSKCTCNYNTNNGWESFRKIQGILEREEENIIENLIDILRTYRNGIERCECRGEIMNILDDTWDEWALASLELTYGDEDNAVAIKVLRVLKPRFSVRICCKLVRRLESLLSSYGEVDSKLMRPCLDLLLNVVTKAKAEELLAVPQLVHVCMFLLRLGNEELSRVAVDLFHAVVTRFPVSFDCENTFQTHLCLGKSLLLNSIPKALSNSTHPGLFAAASDIRNIDPEISRQLVVTLTHPGWPSALLSRSVDSIVDFETDVRATLLLLCHTVSRMYITKNCVHAIDVAESGLVTANLASRAEALGSAAEILTRKGQGQNRSQCWYDLSAKLRVWNFGDSVDKILSSLVTCLISEGRDAYVFRTLKSIALSESFGDPSWNTVRRSAMEMANCIGTQMDWTKSSLCRDTTGIELLHDLFDRMSVIHDERSAEIASHLMSLCMSACCKNSKVVSEWERRKDLESKTRASRSTTPMKVLRNPHAEGGGGGTGGGRNRSLSLVR